MSPKSMALMCAAFVVLTFPAWVVLIAPWLPVYVGLLIAAAGIPLLVWSLRLQERELAGKPLGEIPPAQPFLPTRAAWISSLAWISLAAFTVLPILLIASGLFLLPAGDAWPVVIARLIYLIAALTLACMWIGRVGAEFSKRFRGVFPVDVMQQIAQHCAPVEQQQTPKELVKSCLPWLGVAIFAALLVWDVIDLNNFQMNKAPRRLRGLAAIIAWCQGNPNFTKSTLVIALIVSVVMSVSNLWQAVSRKPQSAAPSISNTADT